MIVTCNGYDMMFKKMLNTEIWKLKLELQIFLHEV